MLEVVHLYYDSGALEQADVLLEYLQNSDAPSLFDAVLADTSLLAASTAKSDKNTKKGKKDELED